MNKRLSVSIGIAAYNAENGIMQMLKSLLEQKDTEYELEKIIIHSDASTDRTVEVVNKINDKRLIVIDNKKRLGFAGSVKVLLETCKGDIVILLNDDILISDRDLLNKLVKPFKRDKDIGLACGRPTPTSPKNFLQKGMVSTFYAYDEFRRQINDGDNEYSCDGKILVFNKKFIKKIKFPKNLKKMGNSDTYFYFLCIMEGFKFRFIKDAKVFYKNPEKISEMISWTIRNNSNKYVLRESFGHKINNGYKPPFFLFWSCMLKQFIRNPLACFFVFVVGLYVKQKAKKYSKKFDTKWKVIETSKI